MVRLGKLTFKNFLSYGNSDIEFNLEENNLVLMTGKNGQGKSVLVDALNYVFFGKPYRKIVLGNLTNRYTGKNLLVTQIFTKNNIEYKIVRGQKPAVFEIYKNNEMVKQLGAREYQEYLETQILGFDEKIFRQIITMGSSYFTPFLRLPLQQKREIIEQLFDLNILSKLKEVNSGKLKKIGTQIQETKIAKEKVEIQIEALKQELKRITTYNEDQKQNAEKKKEIIKREIEENKDKLLGFKLSLEELEKKSRSLIENNIEPLLVSRTNLQNEIMTLENDDYNQKIKQEYDQKISNIKTKKSELDLKIERYGNQQQEHTNQIKNETKKDIDQYSTEIKLLERDLAEPTKLLNFFKSDETKSKCPLCFQEITDELKAEKIKQAEEQIKANNEEIQKLRVKIGKCNSIEKSEIQKITSEYSEKIKPELKEVEALETKLNELINELNTKVKEEKQKNENLIQTKKDELYAINDKIVEIKKAVETAKEAQNEQQRILKAISGIEGQIAGLEKEFNSVVPQVMNSDNQENLLKEQRELLTEHNSTLTKKDEVLKYLKIIEQSLSDGGIRSYIINKYLSVLNTKVNEFLSIFETEYSVLFNETLDCKIFIRVNEEVEYENFSGGERQRLDLSLLLTFASFAKMKSSCDINLLIFDEVLDSSLDLEGIHGLVKILKLFTTLGQTIYVVSHREESFNLEFDKILKVQKDLFSTVETIK